MAKSRPLFLLVSLATTTIILVSSRIVPVGLEPQQLVSDRPILLFLGLWTLGGIPIAFWMPRVRASFFARGWRVPSSTYVVPAGIVYCLVAFGCGHVFALLILAVFDDSRFLWLSGGAFLVTAAFCAGAWHRLLRQREEFEIPWFRWHLRSLGWRCGRISQDPSVAGGAERLIKE